MAQSPILGSNLEGKAEVLDLVAEELETALTDTPSTHDAPSVPDQLRELGERLLDIDGPVLLEIREAIGDEIHADEDWRYDGEPVHPNDPVIDRLGNDVCAHVQQKLRDLLAATSPPPDHTEASPGDVYSVIDLDTGEPVAFTRTISVSFDEPTAVAG